MLGSCRAQQEQPNTKGIRLWLLPGLVQDPEMNAGFDVGPAQLRAVAVAVPYFGEILPPLAIRLVFQ